MIKKVLEQYHNNPKFKQVGMLFGVNIIVIPLSVVSSIIITRFLGPVAYGDFQFLINVFNLVVVIFTFGFFQAGNRALVLNNDINKSSELYGAMLVVLSFLFLIMSVFLVVYAFFDNNINEKGLRNLFLVLTPFSWVFLLIRYFEVLFQADNKISLLAKSRLLPRLVFFLVVIIIYLVFFDYPGNRLKLICFFFIITQIIVFIYILFKVNPSFRDLKNNLRTIIHYNKIYGFNVYLGSVFALGFSQLTGVLISYFAYDNSGVGFFSLATTIAMPLSFIPNVIATTHYKEFSVSDSIPRKLMMITIVISAAVLVLTIILVRPFISIFYGSDFIPVVSLTYLVSFGIILNGFADFINRFLGSHGYGKALRNSAILVGFSLLLLNIFFIPRFGETGAAYTKLLTGLIYLLSMYVYYRKFKSSLEKENTLDKQK